MKQPTPRPESHTRWLSFALGTAGVLVTVAGCYELSKTEKPEPPPAVTTQPDEALRAQLQELAQENQALKLEAIRRQLAAAKLSPDNDQVKPGRCISGTLFLEVDGELRNVGRC